MWVRILQNLSLFSDWYTNAIPNPDTVHLSAPFIDESGAGYVVTLSKAVSVITEITVGLWKDYDIPDPGARQLAAGCRCARRARQLPVTPHVRIPVRLPTLFQALRTF